MEQAADSLWICVMDELLAPSENRVTFLEPELYVVRDGGQAGSQWLVELSPQTSLTFLQNRAPCIAGSFLGPQSLPRVALNPRECQDELPVMPSGLEDLQHNQRTKAIESLQ